MTLEFFHKADQRGYCGRFFRLIIWLLRFLYGPKRKLRDPLWDEWNEEARLKLEREQNRRADEDLEECFEAYARRYFTGEEEHDCHLRLKLEHTGSVFAHAREIAAF